MPLQQPEQKVSKMKKFRELAKESRVEDVGFNSNAARTLKEKPNKELMPKLKEEVGTPPIGVRSLYTKMYAKHGGAASKVKDAQSKAYSEVEKKHGKEMRDSLESFHKKNMNEAVKDKFDIGEYDQEGDMAKSDLRSILANAKRLHDMLEDSDNLPEWVQSKITKAEDYMSTVANYMEAEMNEEVEHHIIKSTHEKDDETGKPLYWNNNDGWGHKKNATKFSSKEKQTYRHIPMNSQWEKHVKEEVELDEENKPTNPELWSRAVSMAKSKFDVYPSAYANGWAAKWYKSKGGGWKSVSEETQTEKRKKDDLPFTPDKEQKKSVVVGKRPEGYSIARHLARQAMKKYVKEEDTEKFYTSSRKTQIVKNAAKNKNENKFEPDPVLSKMADKKD